MTEKPNKDVRWQLRLSAEELETMQRLAQAEGHDSPAQWLRWLVRGLESGKLEIVKKRSAK